MRGLRSVQAQLTRTEHKIDTQSESLIRIEKGINELFAALNDGVFQIRDTLQGHSSELKALRSAWREGLTQIEEGLKNQESSMKLSKSLEALKSHNDIFADDLKATVRDAMNAQFDDMKRKLLQGDKKEQQQILAQLRTVQAQLAEVLVLTKETRVRLDEGLQMLQRTIIHVNQRTCPTLFIILPRDPNEPISEENDSTSADTAVNRAKSLFRFLSDHRARRGMLKDLLHEKEYLSLICELCHLPQLPAIELTKPKEIVGKILPLAKVGLKVACMVNTVSSVGRVFGFPTPVLSRKTMSSAEEFVELMGKSSLDDFELLQERAKRDNEDGKEEDGDVNSNEVEEEESILMQEGYCAREFRCFLKEFDPQEKWCGLTSKVTDDGHVFFACMECCSKLKDV